MTVVLRLAILVAGIGLVVPTADAELRYQDRFAATGLSHVYGGSTDYVVGGGVAALDCNDDLLPDLFLAGGDNPSRLLINRSRPGGAVTMEAGSLDGVAPERLTRVTGA